MVQMMDLNKMGLVPMDEIEMQNVDGSSLLSWISGGELAKLIIRHWSEIKTGFSDGLQLK